MSRVQVHHDEEPCAELRCADGTPVLALPPRWAGVPLGLFNIPGVAECGAMETACPTMLVARRGLGRRWYRSAGRTHQLGTAPGMIELYPCGLDFERMSWSGEAGDCIGIHLHPVAMESLTSRGKQINLNREHEVFDERLRWLADELVHAVQAGWHDALYVEGLSLALLGRLAQRGSLHRHELPVGGRFSAALHKRLCTMIAENLGSDLSMSRLAAEAAMSPDHFAHCFKATFGITPHRFVQQERVSAAKAMLGRSRLSIAQVALGLGFASQSHFTQVFRQHTGTTPARWRRE